MTGRAEVRRLQQQLDAAFGRAGGLTDLELLSDHARYLCVLVSGFLEQALTELVVEHARRTGGPSLVRYVHSRMRRHSNVNTQRLLELAGSFHQDWRVDLERYIVDERKAAIDSVVDLRNTIAHGRQTSVTMTTVRGYYEHVKDVVERFAGLSVP
jgi:hypothetical protein